MKTKKVPERLCMSCKTKKPKKELVRIVKQKDEFLIDYSHKLNGRGAYICQTPECIANCTKQKCLHKAFGANVPKEVYDALKGDGVF